MTVTETIRLMLAACADAGVDPDVVGVYVDGCDGGVEDAQFLRLAFIERDAGCGGTYSGDHEMRDPAGNARWRSIDGDGSPPFRPPTIEEMTPGEIAKWESVKARCVPGIYLARESE